jgi:hypothetical protein
MQTCHNVTLYVQCISSLSGTCVGGLRVTINNTQSCDSALVSRYEFWVIPKTTRIPNNWKMTSTKERRVCKWSFSCDVEFGAYKL